MLRQRLPNVVPLFWHSRSHLEADPRRRDAAGAIVPLAVESGMMI